MRRVRLPAKQGASKQGADDGRDQHSDHIPEADEGRLHFGAVQAVDERRGRSGEQPGGKASEVGPGRREAPHRPHHGGKNRHREQGDQEGAEGPAGAEKQAFTARWIGLACLADETAHQQQSQRLQQASQRLADLLGEYGLATQGCALFQWLLSTNAAALHQHFAQRGILLRHFTQPQSLRFGLPATEADWQRLRLALGELPGSKA